MQLSLRKTNMKTSLSETIYFIWLRKLMQDQEYLKTTFREGESNSSTQTENNNKKQANLGVLKGHLIFKEKELYYIR